MEHRNWNKNNIRTSLLGYGCMRFPTKADGTIDEERAEPLRPPVSTTSILPIPITTARVSRLWAA